MLIDLTIFNTGVSINKRKILSEMANSCGGSPIKICNGNLLVFTWTIQPTRLMNGLDKNRVIEKTTKKGRCQRTRDYENSTGSSGSVKYLTLSSHIQSALCTDFGLYQEK